MSDLVEFLRARLDEDERIANAAAGSGGPHWPDADGEMWMNPLVHARRHDPARVLREVEAKRRILAKCDVALQGKDPSENITRVLAMFMLQDLGTIYADHLDYREEWRP